MKRLRLRAYGAYIAALAAVTLAHLLLRESDWRFEWQNAVFSYGFVTIFTAPVALAFAATFAGRTRRAIAPAWASAGHRRARGRSLARIASAVFGVHLAGLAVVMTVAWWTARSGPDAADLWPALSPLLQLAVASLLGWVVGWGAYRAWWVSPIVAAVWFFASVAFFASGLEVLIRVGGATSSLVGYSVRWEWLLQQWASFGVAIALLSITIVSTGFRPLLNRRLAVTAALAFAQIVLAVGVVSVITADTPNILEEKDEAWECEGTGPEICLTAGYQEWRNPLSDAVVPAFERWRDLGGTAPDLVTLDPQQRGTGVLLVDPTSGFPRFFGTSLIAQQFGDECIDAITFSLHETERDWWVDLSAYVNLPERLRISGTPPEEWLAQDTPGEQRDRAVNAFDGLQAFCTSR